MSASLRRIVPIVMSVLLAFGWSAAGPRIAVPHGGGAPRGGGHAVPHGGGGVPRGGGHAVPHGGGGASHGVAPSQGYAQRGMPAPRGQVPAHGTANGVARYGYGYGGYYGYPYYGYGYPCYGYPYYGYWGWPYWGFGFYGTWGYPYYGYGYGYYPYDSGYGTADAPPPQSPAIIETKIDPGNAEVFLDGESVGYAKDYNGRWDELRTSPGKHTLSFVSGGHKTLTVEIDAIPGGHYVLDNALSDGSGEEHRTIAAPQAPPRQAPGEEPGYAAPNAPPSPATPTFHERTTAAGGRMTIHAKPDDAAVYLDGEYLGTAGELARLHGAIPVATGPHQLQIVRPGFSSDARTVEVGGADVTRVDVTLARE